MPSTGTFSPGLTRTVSPAAMLSTGTVRMSPLRRTRASRGTKSIRSLMARRPRETVRCSSSSATTTNSMTTTAVKNSAIAAAARMAMVMESPMVMRRARRLPQASLNIGQPEKARVARPITLAGAKGIVNGTTGPPLPAGPPPSGRRPRARRGRGHARSHRGDMHAPPSASRGPDACGTESDGMDGSLKQRRNR